MSQQGRAVVIGAGVVGVCAAYFLRERGWEVDLLDKGDVCSGASYGNAGLILPSHSVPLAAPGVMGKGLRWLLDPESPFYIKPRMERDLISWLLRFAASSKKEHVLRCIPVLREMHRASLVLYAELVAREGLQCGFTRRGLLIVSRTREGYEESVKEARLLAEHGVQFKGLEGAALREMEPAIRPEVAGGIFFPEDAHITPGEFVVGIAAAAERQGVRVRRSTEVLALETAAGRVARVRTTRGDFEPDQVVLAAGSWSPLLVKALSLRLPIQAAKGYSVAVKRPAVCPSTPLLLSEARVGVTPMGETLRFAGTLELAGLDLSINRRRVDALLRGARSCLSGLDEAELVEIWRGLRPCTPDGLPVIGRAGGWQNLTIAAGHAMIGQSLGPITGKLVSEVLCGEKPSLDLAPFRVERF